MSCLVDFGSSATAAGPIAEEASLTREGKNEMGHTPQICFSGSKRAKGWIARKSVEETPDGDAGTVQSPSARSSVPQEPACAPRDMSEVAEPAQGVLVSWSSWEPRLWKGWDGMPGQFSCSTQLPGAQHQPLPSSEVVH